jgi:hypothetical protein
VVVELRLRQRVTRVVYVIESEPLLSCGLQPADDDIAKDWLQSGMS